VQPFEVAQGGRDSPLYIFRIAIPIAGSDEHRIEHLRLPIAGHLLLSILQARPQRSAVLEIRAGSVGAEHWRGFPFGCLIILGHQGHLRAPPTQSEIMTQNSTVSRVGIDIAA